MAVTLSPPAIQQFFNNQQQFNAGGSILTQVGGVNYPTYQDSAAATPLPNPIPLNSRGEISNASGLSCQLFLVQGVVYTFTMYDANGNQLNQPQYVTVPASYTQQTLGQIFYPQSTTESAAGITPTYYNYAVGNVLRYGADNTGTSSSFIAIQQALKVACSGSATNGVGNHSRVYFPCGTYKIDFDSVFANPLGPTGFVQRGIIFEGDGMMSSILQLSGAGSTLWFIDGPAGEQQYISPVFRDLGFQGDPVGGPAQLSNGFSLYQTQNAMFFRCWFNTLGTAYQDSGVANGDGTKFYGCRFSSIYTRVVAFNNPQFLNVDLFGCSIEQVNSDIFYVAPQLSGNGAGGGGALRMYGGSIIMNNGALPTWIFDIQAGANLANNNNNYLLDGVQISAMGTTCGTVNCQFTGGQAPHILLRDCNFALSGTARLQVNIAQAHVTYEDCILTNNSGDTYQVVGPTAGGGDQYGDPGSIHFIRCEVPTNLYSFCSTPVDTNPPGDGFSWGYISAQNCYWSNYDATISRVQRFAVDFEINWQNQGRASNGPTLKRIIGKPANRQWTDASGNFNWTVNLPIGAIPIRVLVYRAATATNSAYALSAGTQANATAYGTVGSSNTNTSQSITWDQSATLSDWTAVTNANNQVILSSTGATGQTAVGTTGFFVVEYY